MLEEVEMYKNTSFSRLFLPIRKNHTHFRKPPSRVIKTRPKKSLQLSHINFSFWSLQKTFPRRPTIASKVLSDSIEIQEKALLRAFPTFTRDIDKKPQNPKNVHSLRKKGQDRLNIHVKYIWQPRSSKFLHRQTRRRTRLGFSRFPRSHTRFRQTRFIWELV